MTAVRSLHTSALRPLSEKAIYEACVELYRLAGCRVIRFSQARASRQTTGIPDLKIFAPQIRHGWWMEVKTPTGRQSTEQRLFQDYAEACGETYVLGGVDAAQAQLITVGLARQEHGRFVLVPGGIGEGHG